MTLRVLIADDQPLMRSALRSCLAHEPDIEVVAEAANGRQAVDLALVHHPDVAIPDIRMPVMDGVEATRLIVRDGQPSPPRVVVVTTFDLDEYIVNALRAGASGFLLKDATPEELVHAVRVVAAGDALLAPAVTKRCSSASRGSSPCLPHGRHAGPDPRELSVLRLVARGATNAQIAAELYLAESSVKTHIGHLLHKLGVPDRVHLVIHAYETGLVQPSSRGVPEAQSPAAD